jgi:hypothetical protein
MEEPPTEEPVGCSDSPWAVTISLIVGSLTGGIRGIGAVEGAGDITGAIVGEVHC